jgi:hypothetical protein
MMDEKNVVNADGVFGRGEGSPGRQADLKVPIVIRGL